MTRRPALLALLLAVSSVATGPALGQVAPAPALQATITFVFANPALQPSRYSLEMHEDGTAHYHAEQENATPPEFDRELRIDDGLRTKLWAEARKAKWFTTPCESKRGAKLAFTGSKTLSYAGPEGQGSCTFNYAEDPQMEQLGNGLVAVAATLEEGRRLESLLQHDKLGLDAEVENLGMQSAGGRALDLGNIAPVLQAIADSEGVMTHTRSRAAALLTH